MPSGLVSQDPIKRDRVCVRENPSALGKAWGVSKATARVPGGIVISGRGMTELWTHYLSADAQHSSTSQVSHPTPWNVVSLSSDGDTMPSLCSTGPVINLFEPLMYSQLLVTTFDET